jgi:hypothetical protein
VKHKVIFKNKKFSPYSSVRKSKIYTTAKQICAILQKNKFDAYIVGGAIRDLYIRPNVVPKDLDIATSANPADVHKIFKSSKFVGEAFGVCLVNFNNLQFEVTSFRKEGKYINKRKPENISKGTFLEDSNRRDFTINSLYYDPIKKLIIDPHNGLNDIKNKVIQCVGNPNDRFHEDVLRILRMIRFAANLNFNISKESLQAAKKEVKEIVHLSKERILLEFQKVKIGRFFFFIENIHNIFEIKNLYYLNNGFNFLVKSNNNENKLSIEKIKIGTQFNFFNFFKTLLFKYEVKKNHKDDFINIIDSWPISVDDKKVCLLFFKCIYIKEFFPEKTDVELIDFIFFEKIYLINEICKNISYGVLTNLSIFIKDSLLSETLYKFINIKSKQKSLFINSSEVVSYIEKNKINKKYIATTLKYMQYIYLKKGYIPKIESALSFKKDFFIEYFIIKNK